MLAVLKNSLLGNALQKATDLQNKELEWYINSYWLIASQSTLLAGFAFRQISHYKADTHHAYFVDTLQLILTSVALMAELYVIIIASICCIWAPGLALRGSQGLNSTRHAIRVLSSIQDNLFKSFFTGLLSFIGSTLIAIITLNKAEQTKIKSSCILILTSLLILGLTYRIIYKFSYQRAASATVASIKKGFNLGDFDRVFMKH